MTSTTTPPPAPVRPSASARLRAFAFGHARTIALGAGAAFALPVLIASWALPDHRPRTSPPVPGELANSVVSFATPQGHPEWAVLRDQRQDTTPYKFGHKMHNDPDAAGMQGALAAIKAGTSEADLSGTHTGRAIHVETLTKDGKEFFAMSCTFCHEADAAGSYMRPIRFGTHCVDCHTGSLGAVGASGESLKWVSQPVTSKAAQGLVRPTAVPHGTAKDAGDAVLLALSAWVADQPPQFAVPVAEQAESAAGPAGAKPAEDSGSGRRRRPAAPADEAQTKTEDAAKPAEGAGAQPAESGGRRRGGAASGTGGAEAAKTIAKATLPAFADRAALGVWMAAQRKEIIAGKLVVDACGKCHTGITPGPEASPEAFKISDQKIPEVWLTRSHFSHAFHAMVSCISCHAQAPASAATTDIMLPGVASCRECHAPGATPAGNAAPFDCVLCHTYHERLPQSVQGRMTIDQMRRGGRVVVPATEAPKAPAPAPVAAPPAGK